jgi:hypothetical protein
MPTYGSVDLIGVASAVLGTLYTEASHAWVGNSSLIDAVNDLPTVIPPHTETDVTLMIAKNVAPPWDAAADLPAGATFTWYVVYTDPNAVLYSGGAVNNYPRLSPPPFPYAYSGQDLSNLRPMVEARGVEVFPDKFVASNDPNHDWRFAFVNILNWLNDDVYMDEIHTPFEWWIAITLPPDLGPPPPYEPPPPPPYLPPPVVSPPSTIIPPSTTIPPEVTQRITLEAANPGMTSDITRQDRFSDVFDLFIGQKIIVTAEGEHIRLGWNSRGHVITQTRFQWEAVQGGGSKTLTTTVRIEKIPGTLLPGSGTSNPAQDTRGDGAEVGMFLTLDDASTGLDLSALE